MKRKYRVAFATCKEFPELSANDQLAATELAALGISVVAAVWDAPTDWTTFDAVIIRATWDYWLKYPKFLGWLDALEAKGVRVWNSISVLRKNTDKRYLKTLQGRGFPVVPTQWIDPHASVNMASLMEQNNWQAAVVKPVVSGGAFLTYHLTATRLEGADDCLREIWKYGPAMLQPFVDSITTGGEYSFLFFGGRHSHTVLKKAPPGEFRVQHTYGGTSAAVTVSPRWVDLADQIQKSVGEKLLYARVDMALVGGEPHLMELELTEPSLFLKDSPGAAALFAAAVQEFI